MRLLICTDLDRTLLPNGAEPESPQARPLFDKLASLPEISLAYVTGRNRQLVREAIRRYNLPFPDFVLSDVGTSIYTCKKLDWQPCPEWQTAIARDWDQISHAQLAHLLSDFHVLQLQEKSNQNTFKLSYYAPVATDHKKLLTDLQKRLRDNHVDAALIWSLDEQANRGLLDILPASASKRHAIEFLMRKKCYTLDNTVFSGDSGNDIPVLVSPIPAVLVHNASIDVKLEVQGLTDSLGTSHSLYLAQGGFRGMNGNYAAGIVEGVCHYHPGIIYHLDN